MERHFESMFLLTVLLFKRCKARCWPQILSIHSQPRKKAIIQLILVRFTKTLCFIEGNDPAATLSLLSEARPNLTSKVVKEFPPLLL